MKEYLPNTIKLLKHSRHTAEQTFEQLADEQLFWKPVPNANSIANIVNHLSGNMLSRWTNFLTEDGEKSWRNREHEFEDELQTREELILRWNKGWNCFLGALENLTEPDLPKTIYIRNEAHTVVDAIQRQLAHYASHVGQIILMGKIQKGAEWKSLSIPKGKSDNYNQAKFDQGRKETGHFTDSI